MRSRLALSALMVAAATIASQAQHARDSADRDVLAVEQQWNDARAHADVAALDRLLVDDWTVTHANGTTDSKAKYLADLKAGSRKFAGAVTEHDVAVRVYGDTAVVSGSSNSTVQYNGQAQGGALHFTRVYIQRSGGWKMIVSHATTRPGVPTARTERRGVEE